MVDYICKGEYSMERYLGAKIKELRQSRNWTQAYLAERLNKSVSLSVAMKAMPTPFPPMY